jgi:hypothetical protein
MKHITSTLFILLVALSGCTSSDTTDNFIPPDLGYVSAIIGDKEVDFSWTDPDFSEFSHIEISHDKTGGDIPVKISKGLQSANVKVSSYGTYTFTFKTATNQGALSKGYSKTLQFAESVYGIEVTVDGKPVTDYDFNADGEVYYEEGYEVAPLVVMVKNTGNQPTGKLTIKCSTNAYNITGDSFDDIATGARKEMRITPAQGLSNGQYDATITISGEHGISAEFDVSFTLGEGVYAVELYHGDLLLEEDVVIDLNQRDEYVGGRHYYADQYIAPELSITIRNKGTHETGPLSIGVSTAFNVIGGDNLNVAKNGVAVFKVAPAANLQGGEYTTDVIVSGGHGIYEKFSISFVLDAFTPGTASRWTDASGILHTSIPVEKTQWYTGEVLEYMNATKGDGIDVVILGDAFNKKEMEVGYVYETTAQDLTELMLKMPILRDYKDRFNVYFLMWVDKKSGLFNQYPNGGYIALADRIGVFEARVRAMPQLEGKKEAETTIMYCANGWAGGYMIKYSHVWASYQFCVAEGNPLYWMSHEFAGHSFAALTDLYLIGDAVDRNELDYLSEEDTKAWPLPVEPITISPPEWPWGLNSFNVTWSSEAWQAYISKPGNEIYAGNEQYYAEDFNGGKVWHMDFSTNTMFMGHSISFDTWDRFLIYKRLKELAGEAYSVPDFLEVDRQYLNVSDWYDFLGLLGWTHTFPPHDHNQPSPYAPWDED